jgi:alpha-galactosidase
MNTSFVRGGAFVVCLAGFFLLGSGSPSLAGSGQAPTIDVVRQAPSKVLLHDGSSAPEDVKVVREWTGAYCRSFLVNDTKTAVKVKEVVLCDIAHAYPPATHLYGEGFTMLSQTGGTLGKPVDFGLTDRGHYKIPQPGDATVVYGMLTLSPSDDDHVLLAFTSCRRFVGRFYIRPQSIQAVLDTENLALEPGQKWELEEFTFAASKERIELLTGLAQRLA